MKFVIDTAVFADAVGWAARFLPARPPVPVLAGIRLRAGEGRLTVTTFDYEVCAHAETGADVGQDGTVLVSGRLLAEIARRLTAGSCEVNCEGATVWLRAGRAAFSLLTMPVEDYPSPPPAPPVIGRIDAAALSQVIGQTVVAASHDATVPALCSIRIDLRPDGPPVLSATDRYRVALGVVPGWQPTITEPDDTADHHDADGSSSGTATATVAGPVFVYWSTMAEIAKTMTGDAHLTLGLTLNDDGQPQLLSVQGAGRTLITRTLDGAALDYATLLDKPRPHRVRLDTTAFLTAVRNVAVVAERNTPVHLSFTTATDQDDGEAAGEMTLQAGHGDEATGRDTLPAHIHSNTGSVPPGIAFNPDFLAAALGALGPGTTTYVSFADNTAVAALLCSAPPDNPAELGYRHYLMRIRATS
ncbi:DNA polymerase III subunit beta [Actinomadura rubrisoli]|uniref:DNA polymerase III subunit beta n=1 Tax=Actinomadura rubrisoli TaxID=2530368 RepID=UPI001404D070|nr:hypothetical protein [Actinomadura rubrisoli]